MNHLHDAEFVDLVDGTLPVERQAHAATCDTCRITSEALRATLAATAHDPAPEPSPLFWQHFAARVNAAIDTPAAAAGGSWWSRPRLAVAGFGAIVVAVLALMLAVPSERPVPERDMPVAANDVPLPVLTLDDLDEDEA